jgi:hypothetical protein
MAGKLSSSSTLSVKESAAKLAAADGHAAVLAAAAVLDRVEGVPGVGSYRVEQQFPHPEGSLLYKPRSILKKQQQQQQQQRSGGVSSIADKVRVGDTLQSSSRQLSSVRRVSWAE